MEGIRENVADNQRNVSAVTLIKIFCLSLIGIVMFFLSVDIGGKETILIDISRALSLLIYAQ